MSDQHGSTLGIIPLHFDVPEHHIPLSQFIDCAKSAQDIVDNFNKEFFDNELKFDVRVVAPKEGGLIELIGIGVAGYIAEKCWTFLESEIGKAYTKGLTGHEPSYWADVAGQKTRKIARIDKQKAFNMLLALMVLGFLQKDTSDLERTGLSKEKFRTAYSARNRVYEACIKNTEVRGLGFDKSHDFPIKRCDFPKYIVEIPPLPEKQEPEGDTRWKVDTVDLIVHSPNWKRDNNRKWQGSTTEKQDISFAIEDENFWKHVKAKDFTPKIIDNLRVQWAHPEHASKLTHVRVLRVISYNGTKISAPLSAAELEKELTDYKVEEKEQENLFDYTPPQKQMQEILLTRDGE